MTTTGTTPSDTSGAEVPSLEIQVAWGSITETEADVHLVGHYQGVLPHYAELALDKAVSTGSEHVITDLTKRGVVRGALGDVTFIPWIGRRVVAVAGMGSPGTFGEPQLRELVASVATVIGRLRGREHVDSVLVGSGAGTLSLTQSVRGYLHGLCDAFAAYPQLGVKRVRFVERYLDRAVAALRALEEEAANVNRSVTFKVDRELQQAAGGCVPMTFNYSLLLAAVARESGGDDTALHPWLTKLLADITLPEGGTGGGASPATDGSGQRVGELIAEMRKQARTYPDLRRLALCFPVAEPPQRAPSPPGVTTRMVFSFDGRHVRTSAITESTTVSEREVGVRQELFDDLVERLSTSNRFAMKAVSDLGRFAFERLLHRDMDVLFVDGRPMILDLTRAIAGLPFEMLVGQAGEAEPLGVRVALARQLRTSYSPPPIFAPNRRIERALVIGDPGEGEAYSLPAARKEAEYVRDLLVKKEIKTALLVGSPRDVTGYRPPDSEPASMVAVQQHLYDGVDLVHYCGHGVYQPERPDSAGWVFGNGAVLTAEDLRQLRRAPLLVVANACISMRLSNQTTATRRRRATPPASSPAAAAPAGSDTGLIPGLADEFFRQGVRDFVGAAFAVVDDNAREFAATFYAAVLRNETLGDAVKGARRRLYEMWTAATEEDRRRDRNVSPTWAAYQHYGDPTRRLATPDP